MEHSWLQNVLCGTDTEHPPHRRAHIGYQVHFYYQVSSNPTAAAAASPEPWEDHSMLSRAEVIRKNKAVSLCRLQLLSWKNGTFFFLSWECWIAFLKNRDQLQRVKQNWGSRCSGVDSVPGLTTCIWNQAQIRAFPGRSKPWNLKGLWKFWTFFLGEKHLSL